MNTKHFKSKLTGQVYRCVWSREVKLHNKTSLFLTLLNEEDNTYLEMPAKMLEPCGAPVPGQLIPVEFVGLGLLHDRTPSRRCKNTGCQGCRIEGFEPTEKKNV